MAPSTIKQQILPQQQPMVDEDSIGADIENEELLDSDDSSIQPPLTSSLHSHTPSPLQNNQLLHPASMNIHAFSPSSSRFVPQSLHPTQPLQAPIPSNQPSMGMPSTWNNYEQSLPPLLNVLQREPRPLKRPFDDFNNSNKIPSGVVPGGMMGSPNSQIPGLLPPAIQKPENKLTLWGQPDIKKKDLTKLLQDSRRAAVNTPVLPKPNIQNNSPNTTSLSSSTTTSTVSLSQSSSAQNLNTNNPVQEQSPLSDKGTPTSKSSAKSEGPDNKKRRKRDRKVRYLDKITQNPPSYHNKREQAYIFTLIPHFTFRLKTCKVEDLLEAPKIVDGKITIRELFSKQAILLFSIQQQRIDEHSDRRKRIGKVREFMEDFNKITLNMLVDKHDLQKTDQLMAVIKTAGYLSIIIYTVDTIQQSKSSESSDDMDKQLDNDSSPDQPIEELSSNITPDSKNSIPFGVSSFGTPTNSNQNVILPGQISILNNSSNLPYIQNQSYPPQNMQEDLSANNNQAQPFHYSVVQNMGNENNNATAAAQE